MIDLIKIIVMELMTEWFVHAPSPHTVSFGWIMRVFGLAIFLSSVPKYAY